MNLNLIARALLFHPQFDFASEPPTHKRKFDE